MKYLLVMNHKQIKAFLFKEFRIDGTCWAPEVMDGQIHNKLGNNEYCQPLIILHINEEPLKNRINKVIEDDWFNKQKFGSIALKCFIILSKVEGLEDWQKELKDKFLEMIDL